MSLSRMGDDPGYRPHASGLLVPDGLEREREVWTREEWKAIDRAMKLMSKRGVAMWLGCAKPECRTAPIQEVRGPDGSMILRCAHKDRIFQRGGS